MTNDDDEVLQLWQQLCRLRVDVGKKGSNGRASGRGGSKGKGKEPKEDATVDHEDDDGDACAHCGSRAVALVEGLMECRACHSVAGRHIDHSAEWRYYYGSDDGKTSDPTRCCPPGNDLLPTMGSMLSGVGSNRMLQKYQMWNSMTYRERSLYNIFDTLTVHASIHGIPNCILDEAKVLYKRVSELKISRGENRSALIACSIYMSCKTNRVPRSVKEIASMFHLKLTLMTRGCKLFQEVMKANVQCSAPEDFVNRFCSKLGLDASAVALCRHIVRRADELSLACESTPPSIVAASIYMCNQVLGLGVSKKALAEACQISQVTITKCYKRLWGSSELVLPSNVLHSSVS